MKSNKSIFHITATSLLYSRTKKIIYKYIRRFIHRINQVNFLSGNKISFSQALRELQRYNQLIRWPSKLIMEKPLVLPTIDRLAIIFYHSWYFRRYFYECPCHPRLSVFA